MRLYRMLGKVTSLLADPTKSKYTGWSLLQCTPSHKRKEIQDWSFNAYFKAILKLSLVFAKISMVINPILMKLGLLVIIRLCNCVFGFYVWTKASYLLMNVTLTSCCKPKNVPTQKKLFSKWVKYIDFVQERSFIAPFMSLATVFLFFFV